MKDIDPLEFVPLSATDFQLLLALTAGELHGYAIGKSVREASGGRVRIGLGSLYRILARLLNSGLVEESELENETTADGTTRRKYRLTALGRAVLRAEVSRLSDAVEFARSSQLFVDREA
jgi:DNA-binding PadR family transcriptional regulator